MPHNISLITTIAAALGFGLVLGYIATRLRLPALVGYLAAGIMLGPATPGFVADAARHDHIDRDAIGRDFTRQCLGPADQRQPQRVRYREVGNRGHHA